MLHSLQGHKKNHVIIFIANLGFHGVRPISRSVLIARNPEEIRDWLLRVKNLVGTSSIPMRSSGVIGQMLLKKGFFCRRLVSAGICDLPTEILTNTLSF